MGYTFVRFVVAAVLLCAAGCGNSGPPVGQLYGKVYYKGEPVTEGTVAILCSEPAYAASTNLRSDGSYEFETAEGGVLLGDYVVSILAPQELEPPNRYTPSAMVDKNVANIPKKYRDPKTSGLQVTVKEGDNQFDVKMD